MAVKVVQKRGPPKTAKQKAKSIATLPRTSKGPAAQLRAQQAADAGALAFAKLLAKYPLKEAPRQPRPFGLLPSFGPRGVKMMKDLGFLELSPRLAAQDPEQLYAQVLKNGGFDKRALGSGGPCRCVVGSLRLAVYHARVPLEKRTIFGGWPDFMDKRLVTNTGA
mmetsp:Transcript_78013/g.180912  ORF Transcript_78013/g.180912 Transcript_78013/m.180912 type:complete len:165 (-) Transcript_78013:168-662(-)|eukprot:CAMPEP_0171103050 /NCGR_PEP_ID=MMETSP0766_2-20121228/58709_1 /TAXON_ID=439317 /ORGANISM="Gambierdiscus australes, Strain CAWD 149" /LENGTH=164 /DNA_ID=CAMNT_0011563445 /DNA_START=26 /DNA_END=520 /DNA_ORIENTATION=-